jgi:IS605 OrfB family transposase
MKLTAKVKLDADAEVRKALLDTMRRANAAADWISDQAWKRQIFGQYAVHKFVYVPVRRKFGLSAQVAVRAIAKVADAYKLDTQAKRSFRRDGAISYDERILSWNLEDHTVSIWTIAGRRRIPFLAGDQQLRLLRSRQGESDLIHHRGELYLAATCEAAEPALADVDDFLGVDFGVANIASDSDGKRYSGSTVKSVRRRQRLLRQKLQKKHTTSANRRLKQLAGKEQRFARHVNHVISKQIVARAKGTGRGIALEDLTGIRERITVGRGQRAVLHSWSFAQLRAFVEYKAKLAGVAAVAVDPRNSSRECSRCHHVSSSNRPNQPTFCCRSCGHRDHADTNAASNLRERGRATRKLAIRGSRLSAGRPAKLQAFSR